MHSSIFIPDFEILFDFKFLQILYLTSGILNWSVTFVVLEPVFRKSFREVSSFLSCIFVVCGDYMRIVVESLKEESQGVIVVLYLINIFKLF